MTRWLTWQRKFLFPKEFTFPNRRVLRTASLVRWWIDSPEGRVEAFFLPGVGVDMDHPGPAVIFAHGNAELIDQWVKPLESYRRRGFSLVLLEFRGYGRSAGKPSAAAFRSDFRAFSERILAEPCIDPARLLFHGRSMGAGALCTILEQAKPKAVILQSTFTSLADLYRDRWVPARLCPDDLDNEKAIRAYPGRVLVIHGTRDRLITVKHAHALVQAHGHAELALYEAGHNDLPPRGADYWPRIMRFVDSVGF